MPLDAKIQEILPSIFHLEFPTQRQLTTTFMRFQEHYESPEFKDRIFTREEFLAWYIPANNNDYFTSWSGFNIPSYILQPFYQGLFDPLSEEERGLLDIFEGREERFYIIGTFKGDVAASIDHELCHALFYVDERYRRKALDVLFDHPSEEVIDFLLNVKKYHRSVLEDELQAHISADMDYLKQKGIKTDALVEAHTKLKRLFEEHREGPMRM